MAQHAENDDTKVIPIVPAPPSPRGYIKVADLGALTTMAVGACLLLTQSYISVVQHNGSDGLLTGAGVTLLTAGTVAEIRSHRNGHKP